MSNEDVGIEPSETFLATLGVYPFLSGDIPKLRQYHVDDAERLPREIVRQANRLVSGEEFDMPQTSIKYRGMLDDLSNGVTASRVNDIIDAFPPELGTEAAIISIAATRISQELLSYLPRSEYETLSGVVPLPPSDTRLWKFFAVLESINDPMIGFPLMANGALLKSQADAIKAIYPTLTVAISRAIQDAITKAKATKKSFQLPPKAEYGIRIWTGQPPIGVTQLQQAQSNAAANQARIANQTAMNPVKISDRTRFDATQSQRTETGIA